MSVKSLINSDTAHFFFSFLFSTEILHIERIVVLDPTPEMVLALEALW
jgi:hypothetical protein